MYVYISDSSKSLDRNACPIDASGQTLNFAEGDLILEPQFVALPPGTAGSVPSLDTTAWPER